MSTTLKRQRDKGGLDKENVEAYLEHVHNILVKTVPSQEQRDTIELVCIEETLETENELERTKEMADCISRTITSVLSAKDLEVHEKQLADQGKGVLEELQKKFMSGDAANIGEDFARKQRRFERKWEKGWDKATGLKAGWKKVGEVAEKKKAKLKAKFKKKVPEVPILKEVSAETITKELPVEAPVKEAPVVGPVAPETMEKIEGVQVGAEMAKEVVGVTSKAKPAGAPVLGAGGGKNIVIILIFIVVLAVLTFGIMLTITGGIWAMALILKRNPDVKGISRIYLIMYAISLNWIYVIYHAFKYGFKSLL